MPSERNSKAYSVGLIAALGGFLFGYHIGVISGVLIVNDFQIKMHMQYSNNTCPDQSTVSLIRGTIVGVLLIGCFLGSLIGGQTSDRFSRKYSISFFSFTFTIGVAIQTVSFDLWMLLIGRIISGISIGALSMIVPVYHSEISTKEIRGRMITFQQGAITVGIAISFWINVLVQARDVSVKQSVQWRVPFGLQMIPSVILAIFILSCPFSPRWLISQDREDEARDVLMKIRSASVDEIEEEFNRIRDQVAYLRENEIGSYGQLFYAPLLRPLLLGIGIQMLQQLTGLNSIVYYAPQILSLLISDPACKNTTGSGANCYSALVIMGIFGSVNVLATIPTLIFIDKLGRRKLLMSGALIMSISTAIVVILYETNATNHQNGTYIIGVVIGIFVAGFAFSWGPIPWLYCTEIFPVTMRAKATSLTTAANWTINSLIGFLVPTLLNNLEYGLFIIFSILCAMMVVIIYFFYPETKGTHLENDTMAEKDRIFIPQWAEDRRRKGRVLHEEIAVNEENAINRSNRINNYGAAAHRDDEILEENIDRNDHSN